MREIECESVVQTCAEANERETERGEDTQMGVEPDRGQEISTGSGLLDDHDRRDAECDQKGLKAEGEQALLVDCYAHRRVQGGQFYQ